MLLEKNGNTKKSVCCSVLFTTIEVYLRVISFPYVPHSIMSCINRIFFRFQKKPQSLAKCSTNAWGLWDWVKRAWRKEEVGRLKLYTNVFPLFDEQRKKANIQILWHVQSSHMRETKYDYLHQLVRAIGVHWQQNTFTYRNTIKAATGHHFIELESWIRWERSARSVPGTRGKLLKHRTRKSCFTWPDQTELHLKQGLRI